MKAIDPDVVELCKKQALRHRKYFSRGPNWAWHVDGYDNLKPYGFPIHGCIDGYSRRILWLSIVPSNKNPEILGKLYLDYVKSIGGCPKKVVGDPGTENSYIAALQRYFRRNGINESAAENGFLYGKSVSNSE